MLTRRMPIEESDTNPTTTFSNDSFQSSQTQPLSQIQPQQMFSIQQFAQYQQFLAMQQNVRVMQSRPNVQPPNDQRATRNVVPIKLESDTKEKVEIQQTVPKKKRRKRVRKKRTKAERDERIRKFKDAPRLQEQEFEKAEMHVKMLRLAVKNQELREQMEKSNGLLMAHNKDIATAKHERKENADKIATVEKQLLRIVSLLQTPQTLKQLDDSLVSISDKAKQFRNIVSGDIAALFSLGDIRRNVQLKNKIASFAGVAGDVAGGIPVAGFLVKICLKTAKSAALHLQSKDYLMIRSLAPSADKRADLATIIASKLVLALLSEQKSITNNQHNRWFRKRRNMEQMSHCVRGMLLMVMANKVNGVNFKTEIGKHNGYDAYAMGVLSVVSTMVNPTALNTLSAVC